MQTGRVFQNALSLCKNIFFPKKSKTTDNPQRWRKIRKYAYKECKKMRYEVTNINIVLSIKLSSLFSLMSRYHCTLHKKLSSLPILANYSIVDNIDFENKLEKHLHMYIFNI